VSRAPPAPLTVLRAAAQYTGTLAAEVDRQLESIRAGQEARWNEFRPLPPGRKRLIQIASWSAVLLAAYAFAPPSGPSGQPGSAGSGSGGSATGSASGTKVPV
jgi:hypothetical protein